MTLRKIFFLTACSILVTCTKKIGKKTEVSPIKTAEYSRDIKPFIIVKCVNYWCHAANFPFGDFNFYTDLKKRIDNGRITTLVFGQKLMPPSGSASLATDELNKFKLWIENGAPED